MSTFCDVPAQPFPDGQPDERTVDYNDENRVKSVSEDGMSVFFNYDADGTRVKKSDGTRTTYYFFPEYEETWVAGVREERMSYYFANDQRIAQRSSVTGLFYYHADHLGSAVRLTDELGRIAHSYVYDPYGLRVYSAGAEYAPEEDLVVDDAQVEEGTTSAANTLSTSGDVTVVAGTEVLFRAGVEVSLGPGFSVELGATFGVEMSSVENWAPAEPNTRYQYTDQELDSETSWYYYEARYYDPVLGRFLQADPVLDGLNRYSYVHGNPVRYVDPTGYISVDAAKSWLDEIERARDDGELTNTEADSAIEDWRASEIMKYGLMPDATMSAGPPPQTSTMPQMGPAERLIYDILMGIDMFVQGLVNGWDDPYVDPYGTVYLPGDAKRQAFTTTMSAAMAGASAAARVSNPPVTYESLLAMIDEGDFATAKDGAVFWTGCAEGNQARAAVFAQQSSKQTIEMTPGGSALNGFKLYTRPRGDSSASR